MITRSYSCSHRSNADLVETELQLFTKANMGFVYNTLNRLLLVVLHIFVFENIIE